MTLLLLSRLKKSKLTTMTYSLSIKLGITKIWMDYTNLKKAITII